MMPKLSVKPLFQMVESNDRSPSWSTSTSDRVITLSFGRSIFAMKTNKNGLAAIRPMMMATNRNLRQWRRMKLGRAFVVTGQELRLTRIRLQAGKPCSPLLEIARVLVRFDHVARFIVNANH